LATATRSDNHSVITDIYQDGIQQKDEEENEEEEEEKGGTTQRK